MGLAAAVALLALTGCKKEPTQGVTISTTDTDSGEPNVLSLPDGTGVFIPHDTSLTGPPNLNPQHWVYMSQLGSWTLGASSPPYGSLSGTMHIEEYVDTLDTALPVYECNVVYSLTGDERQNSTCPSCDFVFDVEYYVTSGDPSGCHDVDAPTSGTVWEMGYDGGQGQILLNYYGTDQWLPWYDANKTGAQVDFSWSATLAIELTDTATQ
jgi:hypothetical protein